jgi:hypothetical protein
MRVDGIFEGGGALGTAYVGALRALHDNGVWFKRVTGNSAGAITAAMVAVGFTAPEIQWLSSAFSDAPEVPDSLSSVGIRKPIVFSKFLDLPDIDAISRRSKRKTLLWNALKGTIIDEIGKISLPVPTQGDAVDACADKVLDTPIIGDAIKAWPGVGAQKALKDGLNIALAPLPNKKLRVEHFLPNTEALRTAFADTLWDAIARNSPLQLLMTNLLHEGSFFEGDFFLKTIKELFGRKVHRNPDATVLFKDLKIPLVVIATNIDAGRIRVYSSRTDPNMEVAEAVRQSMSIPFVFEPRGSKRHMVDGGLCSNFPVWLYSPAGLPYWDPRDVDDKRLKVGFSLDESTAAPAAWRADPPRFEVSGTPPHVDAVQVFKPILIEKLVEIGVPRNVAKSEVTWALLGNSSEENDPGIELVQEMLGVVKRGAMNTEESTRKFIVKGLMHEVPYVDAPIPLLGFDGLDFYVNEDEGALMAMWDRAWRRTIETLSDAKTRGLISSSVAISNTQTPFK